jgi:hypothetical protein
MKNAVVSSMLFAAIALAGCNKDQQQQANGEANQAATATKPAAKKQPRRLTAEQLAGIAASGKTGLWADPAEVCSDRAKRRAGTTLEWNVQATGNKAVVVYLLESKGKVRRVTSGDAIGGKPVGGWVRPGTTFVLRAPGNPQNLGKVVIGKKGC